MTRQEHQAQLDEVRKLPAAKRLWDGLEAMSMPTGIAVDGQGRPIVLGLSAEETIEYLKMEEAVYGDREATPAERQRHNELQRKSDQGRAEAYRQYREDKMSGAPRN